MSKLMTWPAKYKILVVLLVVAGALLVSMQSAKLSALGDKYFYDIWAGGCDIGERGYNGGNYANQSCSDKPGVRLIVGQDSLVPRSYVVVQASVASGGAPPLGTWIKINGADYCPSFASGVDNRDRFAYSSGHSLSNLSGATHITQFQVGVQPVQYGKYRTKASNCPGTLTFNLSQADYTALPGVPGVWTVSIIATHIDKLSGYDGIKNGFTITSSGNLTISTKAGGGGYCSNLDGMCTTVQTAVGGESDGVDYMTYMFRFGSDCSVPPGGAGTAVSFYDLDFGTADKEIRLTIHDETNGQWLVGPNPGTWQATQPSFSGSFKLGPANATVSRWWFVAQPRHKYVLYMENVGPHLVTQVGTPYDGAYYTYQCPPPPPPTCSLTVTPGNPDPFTPLTFRMTYGTTIAATTSLTFKDSSGATQTQSQAVAAGGAPVSFTFNPPPGGFSIGNATGTGTITSANGTGSCPITVPILPEPYLSAYGADVIAGIYASNAGSCIQPDPVANPAHVVSWNHDGTTAYGASNDYAGAGGRAAVFASGNIAHFSSGLNITNLKPTGLSFANTTTSGTTYGGQFAALPASCDFTSGKTPTETYSGNHPIAADTLANGTDKFISVTGDVYIAGNIVYANSGGGWTKLGDIPSFKLVVNGGNIYIDKDVTELDGLYVATPDSAGNKGEIFTCATAAYVGIPQTQATYATDCAKQLKIYGAFVAKQVHFDRTYGTIGQATGSDDFTSDKAAEEFIFSPEMWLPNGSGAGSSNKAYQGLPPVL